MKATSLAFTRRARIGMALGVGLALNACDGDGSELGVGPSQEPQAAPPKASPATKPKSTVHSPTLAWLDLGEGREFEIRGLKDGSFLYTQAGPYSARPVEISQELWKQGDPVAIYKRLAPGRAVPSSLTAAIDGNIGGTGTPPSVEKTAPMRSEAVQATRNELASTDWSGWGTTPSWGCPWDFFSTTQVGGDPFCPSGPNSACFRSIIWAYIMNNYGADSYATTCTDSGIADMTAAITQPIPGAGQDEWSVFGGTWRMVKHVARRSCSWWSGCTTERAITLYEVNETGAISHFGGHID